MKTLRVAVLAFDGISLFHLSVPGLVLGAVPPGTTGPRYQVDYCAMRPGPVRSDQGLVIQVEHGLELMGNADIVIVPAWTGPDDATPAEVVQALQAAFIADKMIVGLCLGAFVLGDAGLLDGREATTHWVAREHFAKKFPLSHFRPEVLYLEDENIITSAGTVAAIDCCLKLVRDRQGAEIANRTARLLVTPPQRPGGQAQYIERPVPQRVSEDRLSETLSWAREHLVDGLNVEVLADVAKMSRRTFTRRFKDATGTTVSTWLSAERVARAQALLETTDLSIERIASEAGFSTPLTLRQQFNAHLGASPSEYRQMFRSIQ